MRVRDLLAQLERYVEDGNGDAEVAMAIQPSWPLAMTFRGTCLTGTDDMADIGCTCIGEGEMCDRCTCDDENVEGDRGPVLWLISGDSHFEPGSAYASKELWDMAERW